MSSQPVAGLAALSFHPSCDPPTFSFVANDVVLGGPLDIAATFTGGTKCIVLFNRISAPAPAIHLGADTSHCLVAGNPGATVQNDGKGNIVLP